MRVDLVPQLVCPYCGGGFEVTNRVSVTGSGSEEDLVYGLLRCRCFEFPIVDGVLLLSLAKAYGGAEEELQPYVSLQIAAIGFLQRDDLRGLEAWMRRHLPLAMKLIEGGFATYLEFAGAYKAELAAATDRYLVQASEDEVTGDVLRRARVSRRLGRLARSSRFVTGTMQARMAMLRRQGRSAGGHDEEQEVTGSYYAQRFFSPRLAATHLNRRHLPAAGRILSLCPGHGVFEFSLQLAGGSPETLVCMDAQLINLLVLKHLVGVDGSAICHDLQFRYPFADGWFDGVFSSTCLPEVPAQGHFVREAIRVTKPAGWTLFDSIWTLESGVQRVDPMRAYRFCQNFFESIQEYVPFFRECAGEVRSAGFDISGSPGDYLDGPPWLFEPADVDAAFASPRDVVMSVLVLDRERFAGYLPATMPSWLQAPSLVFSPAYVVEEEGDELTLTLKPEFAEPLAFFSARNSGELPERLTRTRASLEDPEEVIALYAAGVAVALPARFMAQPHRLQRRPA